MIKCKLIIVVLMVLGLSNSIVAQEIRLPIEGYWQCPKADSTKMNANEVDWISVEESGYSIWYKLDTITNEMATCGTYFSITKQIDEKEYEIESYNESGSHLGSLTLFNQDSITFSIVFFPSTKREYISTTTYIRVK